MIAPSLEAMGYRLVRVAFTGGRRATLQVMAERRDEAPMTVEDCAEISRNVSALLDVADPVEGRYDLEGRYENDDALHSRFLPGLALRVSAFFE